METEFEALAVIEDGTNQLEPVSLLPVPFFPSILNFAI